MKKSKSIFISMLLVFVFAFAVGCQSGEPNKPKYTIAFHTGTSQVVQSIVLAAGEPLTAPEPPTKDGYNFAGWWTDPEFEGEAYAFAATMPAGSLNLYAKWTLANVAITFDSMGGTVVADAFGLPGTPVTKPQNPTKADYFFEAWYLEATHETKFNFVFGDDGITVYAKWLSASENARYELSQNWENNDALAYDIEDLDEGVKITTTANKKDFSLVAIEISDDVKIYKTFVITFTGTKGTEFIMKCQGGGVTTVETKIQVTGDARQVASWTVTEANLTDGTAAMKFFIFLQPGKVGAGEELIIHDLGLYIFPPA